MMIEMVQITYDSMAEEVIQKKYSVDDEERRVLFQKPGILEGQFMELGFREYDAKTYIALLELGNGKLGAICKKTSINRVSTLVALARLKKRGVIYTEPCGKKQSQKSYHAYPPRHGLGNEIRQMRKLADDREKMLDYALEGFESKWQERSDKTELKFIEGFDVHRRIEMEIAGTNYKELLEFSNLDEFKNAVSTTIARELNSEFNLKRRNIKSIYTCKKGAVLPQKYKRVERFYIPKDQFDFPGEVMILGDKIILISFQPQSRAVVIRDHEIARVLEAFFSLAVMGAQTFRQNKTKKRRKRRKIKN